MDCSMAEDWRQRRAHTGSPGRRTDLTEILKTIGRESAIMGSRIAITAGFFPEGARKVKLTEEKLGHLQQLTGLNPDVTRELLEQCKGDELEALEWLEQRGSIPDSGLGYYSTAEEKAQPGVVLTPMRSRKVVPQFSDMPLTLGERIWLFFVGNRLVARHRRDESRRIECPLGALVTLLIIAWYVVVGVLLLGLVLGWRYRMEGPQLGADRMKELLGKTINRLRRKGRGKRAWRKKY